MLLGGSAVDEVATDHAVLHFVGTRHFKFFDDVLDPVKVFAGYLVGGDGDVTEILRELLFIEAIKVVGFCENVVLIEASRAKPKLGIDGVKRVLIGPVDTH